MLIKLKNLFVLEKRIGLNLFAIILIILSSLWLAKIQKAQYFRLNEVREEKQLVAKIPELEKQIKIYEDSGKTKSQAAEKKSARIVPVLKGIFLQDKLYYALIGDAFYKEGESCEDFEILKIDFNQVTIQYKNTKETEVLLFSQ